MNEIEDKGTPTRNADGKVYLLAFPASFHDRPIDLAGLFALIRQAAIPAAVAGLILSGIVFGATLLMPRWYRVQTVLMPTESPNGLAGALGGIAGNLGGLAGLAGIRIEDSGSNRAESLAVLRSRQFAEDFIGSHQLMRAFFQKNWDEKSGTWASNADKTPSLDDAYIYFTERVLQISENRTAGTVTVSIEWKNPEEAASWANDLITDLNKYARQRAIDESTRSIEYLQKELDETSDVKLRETIYRLIQEQLAKAMLANVRLDYALKVVDPAKAPDQGRSVRPRRALGVALAFLFGSLIGAAVALWRKRSR